MVKEYPFAKMTRTLKKGAFTKKADAHHKTVKVYAAEIVKRYKNRGWEKAPKPVAAKRTYRQAVLAQVFERIAKKKR